LISFRKHTKILMAVMFILIFRPSWCLGHGYDSAGATWWPSRRRENNPPEWDRAHQAESERMRASTTLDAKLLDSPEALPR
jgi:hypothetical protein